jgi:serine/threonine-protein kinase ULK/ATG1
MLLFQWDSTHIFLVMEFCGGGDLSHFIRSKRALPERIVRKFLQQIGMNLASVVTVKKFFVIVHRLHI